MIEEMIGSIIQAEDEAQEIVKASVAESNNIVNDANKQAEQLLLRVKDGQYAKEQAAVERGEKEGHDLRKAQIEDAVNAAKAMDSSLEKNKKKVIDCIIKELKGKYGVK